MAENRGMDKGFDIIAMTSHSVEYNRAYKTMSKIKRDSVPYPFVGELMDKYNYKTDGKDWRGDEAKFPGFGRELTDSTYVYLANICKEKGIVPMFIHWPRAPEEEYNKEELENTIAFLKELGFIIMDLRNVYDGMESQDLYLASYDRHPNKLAHQLIAEEMMRQMRTMPEFTTLLEQETE